MEETVLVFQEVIHPEFGGLLSPWLLNISYTVTSQNTLFLGAYIHLTWGCCLKKKHLSDQKEEKGEADMVSSLLTRYSCEPGNISLRACAKSVLGGIKGCLVAPAVPLGVVCLY